MIQDEMSIRKIALSVNPEYCRVTLYPPVHRPASPYRSQIPSISYIYISLYSSYIYIYIYSTGQKYGLTFFRFLKLL